MSMHARHARDLEARPRWTPAAATQHAAVQAKLTVGAIDDPLEAEADEVAAHVMRMPEPPIVQRRCADCDEERVQRKPLSPLGAPIRAAAQASVASVDGFPNGRGGVPLAVPTRTFMESRFGADFADVRVHADDDAASAARRLHAEAFTIGRDIYFDTGHYSPESDGGKRLLAHELAHVIQQGTSRRPFIQRQISGCGDLVPPILTLISGSVVHRAIQEHFASAVGGATQVAIPGASAAPLRSQGICGYDEPVITPQTVGGAAGAGFPDLARITSGGILQVAEIKPAALPCLVDGEEQLLRYIDQGNAQDPAQVAWRASLGVKVVTPMLQSAYPPPSLVVPPVIIRTAWCTAGLLAYTVDLIAPPAKVPETETSGDKKNTKEPQGVPVLTPKPAMARESTWHEIAQWARSVHEKGMNATEAAERFLGAHPELVWAVIGLDAIAIVGLIADDATIAGIADDVLVPILAALEWAAARMAWGMLFAAA